MTTTPSPNGEGRPSIDRPADGESPASPPSGVPLVLIPVYEDRASLRLLLGQLDAALAGAERAAEVLVVNDGSAAPAPLPEAFDRVNGSGGRGPKTAGVVRGRVLELRRNLGHQRAIAVGLGWVADHDPPPAVVIMDADGEDDPADLPRLLDAYDDRGGSAVVFAGRTKRSESFTFRAGYLAFRVAHRLLTGRQVRVGNYSVLPRPLLDRLVVVSELWNHYAAAVHKAKLPTAIVPTRRGRRLAGESTMNLVSLVTHGLSAISVFSDTVGVRLILATAGLIVVVLGGLATVVGVRLATDWSVPGWATYTSGLLLVMLLQVGGLLAVFVALILSGRQGLGFLPARDYAHFCGQVREATLPGGVTTRPDPDDRLGGTRREHPSTAGTATAP